MGVNQTHGCFNDFRRHESARCVEPDHVERIKTSHEFLDLQQGFLTIILLKTRLIQWRPTLPAVTIATGLMPILRLRIIHTKTNACLLTLTVQFCQGITTKVSKIRNIVRMLRIKHRKTVMVLRGDDHKTHARIFAQANPFLCVKFNWVKWLRSSCLIVDHWNFRMSHNPFRVLDSLPCPSDLSIWAPMDKHPNFIVIQLLHRTDQFRS